MTARSLPSRLSRVFVNALSVVIVALTWPASAMAQQPAVVSYELVSYRFVKKDHLSRSLFLFTYRATISNTGVALSGATAAAVSLSPDLTVVDGALTFGPVPSGGTSVSTDTFSFQMERRDHLDWNSLLQWTITATTANRAPTANAGPDQATAGIGIPVTLDGSGSTDPDGDTLTYQWTIALAPEGSSAALGGPSTAMPGFVPDRKGVYAIRLAVDDGTWSAADEVTVTVANTPPTAVAGPDLMTFVGQPVQLDGTASSDVDGDPLTYWWALISVPPLSASALSDATAPAPTFLVGKPGTYTLQLLLSDGVATSTPATVSVVTQNSPPVSTAGPDQTAPVGTNVTLDGSASSDVDGDPLTYSWAFVSRPGGSAAVLTDTTAVSPSFIIDRPGTYQLTLAVNDGTVASAPDTVIISTVNSAPVANAGADQSAAVTTTVVLNGSASTDVDGDTLSFTWVVASRPVGSAATLTGSTSVSPTFVVDMPGSYELALTVQDGTVASIPDTIIVTTTNSAPVANAGQDRTAQLTEVVALNGSASSDVDGDSLSYAWSFAAMPAGSAATLSNPTVVSPTFVVDVPGVYVAQLLVHDGTTMSPADTVTITTVNSPPTAMAGPDQSALAGQPVTLDGSGSSDVDNDALTFMWAITTRPAGSAAAITNTSGPLAFFTADVLGTYVAQLIVSDGFVSSAPDTVIIDTRNTPPAASAGSDQLGVPLGGIVQLDGSGSTDADGHALTFAWSLLSKPAGSVASISVADAVAPTFAADVPGDYVAQLIVHDGFVASAPDAVLIRTAAQSQLEVSPAFLTFPAIAVTEQSATKAVVVSNAGATVLTFSSATVTGEFSVAANTCGELAPTETCQIELLFAPANEGAAAGSLEVVFQSGAATFVSDVTSLSGTGVSLTTVTVAATDAAASETGPDPGTFTITRVGDTASPLSVAFHVFGSATSGSDYIAIGGPVVIPAGAASATVTVTPIDDAATEEAELVMLTLVDGPGYSLGAGVSDTVTIEASDVLPVVTITASDPEASEASLNPGTFVITRTATLSTSFTVSLTRGGTAIAGVDYTGIPSAVTFAAGQASATLTVTPIDDPLVEIPKSVTVSINPDSSYTLGAETTATVTIASEDVNPVVTIAATDQDAAESPLDTGTFVITRTANLGLAFTVSLTRGGTALSGVDYASIPASVSFAAGQTTATLTVTPVNDALVEGPETVTVAINPSAAFDLGAQTSAAVTIASEDVKPVVTITATDPDAAESPLDTGTFVITRTANLGLAFTVSLTRGGTALSGVDYASIPASVSFAAGQTTVTLTVTPNNDATAESAETVILTINAGAAYDIGAQSSAIVVVTSDE